MNPPQNPIRVLITGGTSGIGRQTAIALAKQGAEVILTSRNESRGTQAAEEIRRMTGNPRVTSLVLDLGTLASVRSAAAQITDQYPTLDVLINNSGILRMKREVSADGFELNLAVNFLGPFLFTLLLLKPLRAAPKARIVMLASDAHFKGRLDFSDLQFTKGYQWLKAYGASKLAVVAFTLSLSRRLARSTTTINCLHPGMARTHIWPRATFGERLFSNFVGLFAVRDTVAAAQVLSLAVGSKVEGRSGLYFDRDRETAPSPQATDPALQDRLWQWSTQAAGMVAGDV